MLVESLILYALQPCVLEINSPKPQKYAAFSIYPRSYSVGYSVITHVVTPWVTPGVTLSRLGARGRQTVNTVTVDHSNESQIVCHHCAAF